MRILPHKWMRAIRESIRLFVPMNCPVCGGIPFDGTPGMFCSECLSQLSFSKEPLCPGCGGHLNGIFTICADCLAEPKRPWKQAFALFKMEGLVRNIIHKYKYRKHPELARALGVLAAQKLPEELLNRIDMIVPTPLHWSRYLWRGFNQAGFIAEGISAGTGLPVKNILRRVKRTREQARLKRKERISNINNAFSISDSTIVQKRAILLIDDVMTTGTTLAAETKLLQEAGASEVYVLVIARRQRS